MPADRCGFKLARATVFALAAALLLSTFASPSSASTASRSLDALTTTTTGGPSTGPSAPTTIPPAIPGPAPATTDEHGLPGPSGSFAVSSASFVSEEVGWALGVTPCRSAPERWCTALARTVDGGNAWTTVPAPPAFATSSAQAEVTELHFANDVDGYAYANGGNGLWVTADAGDHWTFVSEVSGITSWEVGSIVTTSSDVYATVGSDSGVWRLVDAPLGTVHFRIVQSLDTTPGVPLTGGLTTADGAVYVLDGASMLRVDGAALSSAPLPPGTECGQQLTASTATAVLLECGSAVADGAMGERELFGTSDGGQSWIRLPDPGQGAGFDDAGIADGGAGHAVLATVGAGGGSLLVTTDYGISWTPTLAFHNEYGSPVISPSYQDPFDAVVVYDPAETSGPDGAPRGTGELFRSTNAGLDWSRVTVSPQ